VSERPGWLRNVVLLLAAQSLSLFGSSVVGYSVIWYVTLKTGSGGQYALLLIANSLAMALTTVPGGIWADRHWRKALIMGADGGMALAIAVLAVVMLRGHEALWVIALALAFRGFGGGILAPAVNATIPQLVPAGKLMRVNSINQAIAAVIQVAAPALAVVLLVYWPLGDILLIYVAAALLAIGITAFVPIPRLAVDPAARRLEGLGDYLAHLWEAMRYAARFPGLKRAMVMGALLLTLIVPFAQMTPVFVVRLYGDAKWMLAVVEITWSLGMVLGGLVIAAWGGLRNRMAMMMIACLMAGALTMVMGFMPTIWWFVGVMVVMGFSLPMLQTPLVTAIQELIPETMMGRVMSVVTLVSTVCGPLGMAIFGPLADHVSLSWLALACGAAGVVILGTLALRGGPATRLYAPGGPASGTC